MIPCQALINNISGLTAEDPDFLADVSGVNPLKLTLIVGDFTPSPALVLANVTLITAVVAEGWAAPVSVVEGTQNVVRAASGAWGIYLKEPLGGFKWFVDDEASLPVVVTGYALVRTNGAGGPPTELLASELFDEPITLQFIGDYVELTARFGFFANIPLQ